MIFFGGSSTECRYVDEKIRFPYLVGRLLEKNGKKINSFNSGVSGNHSLHSIDIFLNKGLKLNPDIAVMMHNINDLNILLYQQTYWNNHPYRSLLTTTKNVPPYRHVNIKNILHKILPNIYTRLSILKDTYLDNGEKQKDEFVHLRGKRLTIDKNEILEKFERNLRAFINISRAYGVTPILMTQANRFKKEPDKIIIEKWRLERDFGITYEEYRDIFFQMNQVIRRLAISDGVLVIDLAMEVPQSNTYMYDVVHFNDHGSKHVSSLIADQLHKLFHTL